MDNCYKCKKKGHLARACPQGSSSTGGGGGERRPELMRCFKCDDFGHFARDCKKDYLCYFCKEPGHFKRDCKKAKGRTSIQLEPLEEVMRDIKENPEEWEALRKLFSRHKIVSENKTD